jgi:hypothetical protein
MRASVQTDQNQKRCLGGEGITPHGPRRGAGGSGSPPEPLGPPPADGAAESSHGAASPAADSPARAAAAPARTAALQRAGRRCHVTATDPRRQRTEAGGTRFGLRRHGLAMRRIGADASMGCHLALSSRRPSTRATEGCHLKCHLNRARVGEFRGNSSLQPAAFSAIQHSVKPCSHCSDGLLIRSSRVRVPSPSLTYDKGRRKPTNKPTAVWAQSLALDRGWGSASRAQRPTLRMRLQAKRPIGFWLQSHARRRDATRRSRACRFGRRRDHLVRGQPDHTPDVLVAEAASPRGFLPPPIVRPDGQPNLAVLLKHGVKLGNVRLMPGSDDGNNRGTINHRGNRAIHQVARSF